MRQVVLPDRVLAAGRVLEPVLVQHEDVEPLVEGVRRAVRRPHPAREGEGLGEGEVRTYNGGEREGKSFGRARVLCKPD